MLATSYKEHLHVVIGNLNEDPRGLYCFIRLKRAESGILAAPKIIISSSFAILTDLVECSWISHPNLLPVFHH